MRPRYARASRWPWSRRRAWASRRPKRVASKSLGRHGPHAGRSCQNGNRHRRAGSKFLGIQNPRINGNFSPKIRKSERLCAGFVLPRCHAAWRRGRTAAPRRLAQTAAKTLERADCPVTHQRASRTFAPRGRFCASTEHRARQGIHRWQRCA